MNISKISFSLLILLSYLVFCCGDKEKNKTPLEKQTEAISKNWIVSSVDNANGDPADFKVIELMFNTNNTYSQKNDNRIPNINTPAEKTSGSWKFEDETFKTILFDGASSDEKRISNLEITATTLTFDFTGQTGVKPENTGTVTYHMVPKL